VLPGDDAHAYHLRPLIGLEDALLLHRRLIELLRSTLPTERPVAGRLSLPSAERIANAVAVRRFAQATPPAAAHQRIRQAVWGSAHTVRVTPRWPPDLLGVLALAPITASHVAGRRPSPRYDGQRRVDFVALWSGGSMPTLG
jgi:hypothetical protein